MTREPTIAARDLRLAQNSTPPVELGWTVDDTGYVFSNGCACVWRNDEAGGAWHARGCRVHGNKATI